MITSERLRPLARRLEPLQRGMQEGATRWRALPSRDRLAIGAAALLVVLAFLWLVLTKPALDAVARWQQELPKLRAQSAELDRLLVGVRGSGVAGPSESPQAGLDRAGLQGFYRLQVVVSDAPAATGSAPPAKAWRIEFDKPVEAALVFPWLTAVSARSDIEIIGAALDRADGAAAATGSPQGLVRGVVDLQSTQHYKDGP
ncbi:UNVERIFIED_ORG: type II secretory pathway component PulM [Variovorax paradoxus]|nr:type II secretory pathway component PulM [Variovorax paradoxus]